jgi:hypothetical protein
MAKQNTSALFTLRPGDILESAEQYLLDNPATGESYLDMATAVLAHFIRSGVLDYVNRDGEKHVIKSRKAVN